MKAKGTAAAWAKAKMIFPTDYEKDETATERAGYSVYRSTVPEFYGCWISDLGDRLEVNIEGETVNIWIEAEFDDWMIEDALKVIDEALYQIEDKVNFNLRMKFDIDKAHDILGDAYEKLIEYGKKNHPNSSRLERFKLW